MTNPVAHLLGFVWLALILMFVILVNEGLWRAAAVAAALVLVTLLVAWWGERSPHRVGSSASRRASL
jgi:hypothetical protein